MINGAAHYDVRRARVQGDNDTRLEKIQKMRDDGLISEQEYQKISESCPCKAHWYLPTSNKAGENGRGTSKGTAK